MFKDKNINVDYVDEVHGPLYTFLSSFGTHFLNFMSANVLYVIFNIPAIILGFMFTVFLLPQFSAVFIPDNFVEYMNTLGVVGNKVMNDVGGDAVYQLYYLIVVFVTLFLIGSGLIPIGPFQSGFQLLYRNVYRCNVIYLIADIKEGIARNWKQSLIAMLISYGFTGIILVAIAFYMNNFGKFGSVVATFFAMSFVFFIAIQNMVYQMIVSVDLPLRKIYKNAILFLFMRLGTCVGMLIVNLVLMVVIPYVLFLTTAYISYAVVLVLYLTIMISFVQYMYAFFTGEMIKTYVINDKSVDNDTEEVSDNKE